MKHLRLSRYLSLILLLQHKYSAAGEEDAKILPLFDASLSFFMCEDVPQCPLEYKGHGLAYVCNERKEVQTCHSPPAAVPDTMPRGACRRACHFNRRCGSFAWSPFDAVCRQCLVLEHEERKSNGYQYVTHVKADRSTDTSTSRKIVYGSVLGPLTSLNVDKSDYIEHGYVKSKSGGHILQHAFIPLHTRQVDFVFRGSFCSFQPILRGSQQGDLPGSSWMSLTKARRARPSLQTSAVTIVILVVLVTLWRRKIMKVQRQLQSELRTMKGEKTTNKHKTSAKET